jgi:hypothetical protein
MRSSKQRVKVTSLALVVLIGIAVFAESGGADAKRRRRPRREPDVVQPTPTPTPAADTPFTVEYVEQVTPVPPGLEASVTATCPAGTKVLGGTANFTAPANEGMLSSSNPAPAYSPVPSQGWSASAYNDGTESRLLTVVAACGSGTDLTVQYIRTSATIRALDLGAAKADCPADTKLTGGGVVQNGPASGGHLRSTNGVPGNTTIPATGWAALVKNVSATPREMTVTAICAKSAQLEVQQVKRTVDLPKYQAASGSASCPTGTTVLGGGAYLFMVDTMSGSIGSIGSLPGNAGISASAANRSNSDSAIMLTALCAASA